MKNQSILQQGNIQFGGIPSFGDAKPNIKYSCKRCGKESDSKEDLCKPGIAK